MKRLKIAAGLLLTSPFVPLLFQGEEWGASSPFLYFTAHDDDDLGRQVSEGRRNEFAAFGWEPTTIPDPQSPQTFERSRLRWDELASPAHAELLDWYRVLIALRRQQPSFRDGDYRHASITIDEQQKSLCIRRGSMLVVCNLGQEAASLNAEEPGRMILASDLACCYSGAIQMPGESIAVFEYSHET